ncbi:MAG: glycosyltransferase family 8 protein [bacterium]|nr:glycosyltransferase family 8 protein [bacterium]
MNEDTISIIFSCSNSYIPYLSVAIQSISNTANPSLHYNIYIMHNDSFDLRRAERIQTTLAANLKIYYTNVTKWTTGFPLPLTARTHVTEESYYKLLIPRLFPHLKKVIYLDVDVVVLKDLSALYQIDLDDNLIGGVPEYLPGRFATYVQNTLGIDRYEYINAGVVLMDTERLNPSEFEINCRTLLSNNPPYYMLNQDILNIVCYHHIKYLDSRWNLGWNTRVPILYELKAPFILHYTTKSKPWNTTNRLVSDYFWETSHTCAFEDELRTIEATHWSGL